MSTISRRTVLKAIDAVVRATPVADLGMAPMYDWLISDPLRPVLGRGADTIMDFNHSGARCTTAEFDALQAADETRLLPMPSA